MVGKWPKSSGLELGNGVQDDFEPFPFTSRNFQSMAAESADPTDWKEEREESFWKTNFVSAVKVKNWKATSVLFADKKLKFWSYGSERITKNRTM